MGTILEEIKKEENNVLSPLGSVIRFYHLLVLKRKRKRKRKRTRTKRMMRKIAKMNIKTLIDLIIHGFFIYFINITSIDCPAILKFIRII